MISTAIAASMLSMVPTITLARTVPVAPPTWGTYQPQEVQPERRVVYSHWRIRRARRSSHSIPDRSIIHEKTAPPTVTPLEQQLRDDVAALRREIADIKAEVNHQPIEPSPLMRMISLGSPPRAPVEVTGLPDLRLAPLPEAQPLPQPLPSLDRLETEAVDRVRRATLYLIKTAIPGFTMVRQGPEVALGRLHPDLRVRLAEAIKRAHEAGMAHVGVFSAYRSPIFGVGGFGPSGSIGPKFNSLHSYGLAVDVAGIGNPGSNTAHLWKRIVDAVGLYLPYGPNNRSEFNHTQLLPTKIADARLRKTITASAPKDLMSMWLASGVKTNIVDESHVPVLESTAHKLPLVDWTP